MWEDISIKQIVWVNQRAQYLISSCIIRSLCLFPPAVPQVLDTLSDSASSTTANDLDLIFLKGIMESPVVSFLSAYSRVISDLNMLQSLKKKKKYIIPLHYIILLSSHQINTFMKYWFELKFILSQLFYSFTCILS